MKKKESPLSRREAIKGVARVGLASVFLPLTGFTEPDSENALHKVEDNVSDFPDQHPLNSKDFNSIAVIYTPSIIYATEGVETNIYFDNVIFSNLPNNLLDIDISCIKGRANNFNKTTMTANSRSTRIIDTWGNGVHPDKTGYYQMGDALYSFIKNLSA